MSTTKGFHLIEILIALSIISILASIAIPSYLDHLTREKRIEAETILMQIAIAMEKYHIENNSYQNVTLSTLNFTDKTVNGNYQLIIKTATKNDYELIAKPLGLQADRDAACGQLALHANGEKNVTGYHSVTECWM